MTASHADLLPVGGELVLVGAQERSLPLAIAPVTAAVGRRPAPETADSSRLDRDRTASFADEGGASAVRFEARGRAPDEPAAEENRMRLLAALLVLGTLLLWIAFLKD